MRSMVVIGLVGLGLAACSTAHNAADKAKDATHTAAVKARAAGHSAAEKAKEAGHSAAEKAHDATHPTVNPVGIDKPEKEGVAGAVQAPFEDVNVIRSQIPPVLLRAADAPYARPDPASCRQISTDVAELDDALGDDLDIEEVGDSNLKEKRGRQAGEAMVLAMRDTAEDFIPFRNWVRRLSGAQAHDNQVRAAVYAGRERRSYLKGLGEALGCRYPAAPKGASPVPVRPPPPPPRRR
jgi:hypothetical protein